MSASTPRFVLLPAVFAVPLFAPFAAKAQQKTPPAAISVPRVALTAPATPATSIAPRQILPTFTPLKAALAPVSTAPTAAISGPSGQATKPPVAVVVAPLKAAALPKSRSAGQLATASLSEREAAILAAPAPVAATPPILRGRRAFGSAVSLSTSPQQPSNSTPKQTSLVVAAPVKVKAIEPLPQLAVAPIAVAPVAPVARPSVLASREAKARDIALARLDAQLAGAEGRLNRAQTKLTEGQRQLGSVNTLLQNAMLSSGGSGLHPFVRVAQRYLGTPYVWGGESARGFDCSGFIMRVMRDLGYKALPHSAAEQFNYGKPVAKNLLQPGDIVFFANTYKAGVSHVGIYLGGGRFIHAANSQVGTIVSNLNSAKWVEHYAGARRLMKMS